MDNVREKVKEQNRSRHGKMIVGLVVLLSVILLAVMIEKRIDMNITEITIMKNDISGEKAEFIPVKQLDTNVIAVKLTDGSYRLAFDDCKGCYIQYGKHAQFKNNEDNTGIVCENCKNEVAYEDIGYDSGDVVIPYPIYENEIINNEESFVLSVDYLEKHKLIFEELRLGKGMNKTSEMTKE